MNRKLTINGLAFGGLTLISVGAFMVSLPAGLIAIGSVLFITAVIAGVVF